MNNKELLKTQMNSNENSEPSNNNNIIKRTNIDGTPFTLIQNEGKYFITYGKYRITDEFDNIDDVHDELIHNQWNIIARMIGVTTEYQLKETIKP